jgi:branched-chain amino acid transport system permease protein
VSFGVLNVLNLAHGEFLMLGSLLSYCALAQLGVNPFVSAVMVIPFFTAIGVLFFLLLIRPLGEKPPHELLVASILVTLGASLAIEDLTAFFWERPVTGIDYSLAPFEVGGVVISSLRLLILLFICVLPRRCKSIFGVRSRVRQYGRSPVPGRSQGRRNSHPGVSALTFGQGGCSASAGVFYVTLFTMTPTMGIPLTSASCVWWCWGIGSLVGSVVGGLILMAEAITACYGR